MSPGSLTYEVPHRPRWSKFSLGFGINSVCVLLLAITNPQVFSEPTLFAAADDHHVILTGPISLTRPEPPRRLTTPTHLARIEPPRAATPPTAEPIPIPRKPISTAPEVFTLATNMPASLPPKPAPVKQIKTDVFSAPADSATLHLSAKQVQTGGFGDPNGVAAQDPPKTVPVTVASVGAFDLPPGAGRGNGTAGSQGTSGTVQSAGFPDTTSPTPSAPQEARTVQTAGFGSVVVKATTPSAQPVREQPVVQPVEILFKPRPAYTPEARQQKVEGEVLLDVVFTAAGSLHVNRVVKGLGHGLDDMAVSAAQRIQFHPATRDGKPYDCAALVRIVFQLSD